MPSFTHLQLVPPANESPPLDERDDDALMLLTLSGRAEAFDVLVRRHQARLLNIAAKLLSDPSLAIDATQQAFLELYRGRARYRAQGQFFPYITRILVNQCRMLGRAQGRRLRFFERLTREQQPASLQTPDEALAAKEQQDRMHRALAKLSDKLRAVVVLRYNAGLSIEEIGVALEIPLGTVKSRLSAAMDALRAQLEGLG